MQGETGANPVRARRREAHAMMLHKGCISIRMPQSGKSHWGNLRRWMCKSAKSKDPSIGPLLVDGNQHIARADGRRKYN